METYSFMPINREQVETGKIKAIKALRSLASEINGSATSHNGHPAIPGGLRECKDKIDRYLASGQPVLEIDCGLRFAGFCLAILREAGLACDVSQRVVSETTVFYGDDDSFISLPAPLSGSF